MRAVFASAFRYVVLKSTAGQPFGVLSIASSNAYKLSFMTANLTATLVFLIDYVDIMLPFLANPNFGSDHSGCCAFLSLPFDVRCSIYCFQQCLQA